MNFVLGEGIFFFGGGVRFFGGRYRDSFRGEIKFWEGAVFRGRRRGFFGQVGGRNKVVCLKTRTLLTCLLGKKSDLVEFFIWGGNFFFGGGSFFGGDIEVFSGGIKF